MRDPGGAPQQNFFEFGYENIFKVLKILSWEIEKIGAPQPEVLNRTF